MYQTKHRGTGDSEKEGKENPVPGSLKQYRLWR